MFEGIRRNIAETRARLKRLDIGRTARRLKETRKGIVRNRRARREYLDARDKALDEWERLIKDGRDRDDDHVLNVHHRARKADHLADEHGEKRADLARMWRALKRALRSKTDARKKLQHELRGARKNLRKHRAAERRRQQQATTSGVGTYDGKPIAAWMIPTMNYARSHGWGGTLTSGYRSPEYSQQLCYGICGAPVCPGRCAGTTSNHTKNVKPEGAVDVSDPVGFANAQSALHCYLAPADPWHFSVSGR